MTPTPNLAACPGARRESVHARFIHSPNASVGRATVGQPVVYVGEHRQFLARICPQAGHLPSRVTFGRCRRDDPSRPTARASAACD